MLSTKIFCALITRQGRVAVYSAALLCCNTSLFLHQLKVEWILFHYYYRLSIIRQDLIITSEAVVMNKYNNDDDLWRECVRVLLVLHVGLLEVLGIEAAHRHPPRPHSRTRVTQVLLNLQIFFI